MLLCDRGHQEHATRGRVTACLEPASGDRYRFRRGGAAIRSGARRGPLPETRRRLGTRAVRRSLGSVTGSPPIRGSPSNPNAERPALAIASTPLATGEEHLVP